MEDIHLDWEVEKNYYEIIILFIFRMASLIAPCSKLGHIYTYHDCAERKKIENVRLAFFADYLCISAELSARLRHTVLLPVLSNVLILSSGTPVHSFS
jgi:hypothetical protein